MTIASRHPTVVFCNFELHQFQICVRWLICVLSYRLPSLPLKKPNKAALEQHQHASGFIVMRWWWVIIALIQLFQLLCSATRFSWQLIESWQFSICANGNSFIILMMRESLSFIEVFQCNGSLWAFSGEKFSTYHSAIGKASSKAVKATVNHAKKSLMKQTSK